MAISITDANGKKVTVAAVGPPGAKGEKGNNGLDGTSAGFGAPIATIDDGVGSPSVSVSASGPDTAKVFNFNFKNIKGNPGNDGEEGKSAYELAVEHGYAGTVDEWLASLKGEKGDPGSSATLKSPSGGGGIIVSTGTTPTSYTWRIPTKTVASSHTSPKYYLSNSDGTLNGELNLQYGLLAPATGTEDYFLKKTSSGCIWSALPDSSNISVTLDPLLFYIKGSDSSWSYTDYNATFLKSGNNYYPLGLKIEYKYTGSSVRWNNNDDIFKFKPYNGSANLVDPIIFILRDTQIIYVPTQAYAPMISDGFIYISYSSSTNMYLEQNDRIIIKF